MKGIRRHGAGWQVEVRVVGHPRSVRQFPLDTPAADMLAWRKAEKARRQLTRPRMLAGTLATDARDYLKARAAMPGIKERTRHIGLWVERFGTRRRDTIKAWEIAAVRDEWLTVGPHRVLRKWKDDDIDRHGARWVDLAAPLSASQVCKRMRALENLYTVLDGLKAPNPVREAGEPKEPESEARGLPYELIEAILAAMPDRSRGLKGEKRRTVSLTKLRCTTFAYVGLSHGELEGIDENVLHLDERPPWVWVAGRLKGKGTSGVAQPLTEQGAQALRALRDAHGLGPFSASSMLKSVRRACRVVAPGGELDHVRPYDLRHSFASEVFAKTGKLDVTQLLMRQKDQRTTLRYGKRAVDPVLAAAVEQLRASGAFAASEKRAMPATDENNGESV